MMKNNLSKEEVAQILENFLEGKSGRWDWDDYSLGMCFEDECLERIRIRCRGLSQEFPAHNQGEYCNPQGLDVIRDYIKQLRASE